MTDQQHKYTIYENTKNKSSQVRCSIESTCADIMVHGCMDVWMYERCLL